MSNDEIDLGSVAFSGLTKIGSTFLLESLDALRSTRLIPNSESTSRDRLLGIRCVMSLFGKLLKIRFSVFMQDSPVMRGLRSETRNVCQSESLERIKFTRLVEGDPRVETSAAIFRQKRPGNCCEACEKGTINVAR